MPNSCAVRMHARAFFAAVLLAVAALWALRVTAQDAPGAIPAAAALADPNLPKTESEITGGLAYAWGRGFLFPEMTIFLPSQGISEAVAYLGFTDEGSFVQRHVHRDIWVWNLPPGSHAGTLTLRYKTDREIPQSTVRQLAASIPGYSAVDYLLVPHPPPPPGSKPPAAPASASQAIEDPNMPRNRGSHSPLIHWGYGPAFPTVEVRLSRIISTPHNIVGTEYLGFADEGSFVMNNHDGKVYVWKYDAATGEGRLSVSYESESQIPRSTLEQLDRSQGGSPRIKGDLARLDEPAATSQPAAPATPPKNVGGGAFGAAVRAAVAANGGLGVAGGGRSSTTQGTQGATTGTHAEVANGVLSFADSTGKRVTMKVQRGTGTGTWLAFNVNGEIGNDKIIHVLPNGNMLSLPLDPSTKAQLQGNAAGP